MKKEHIPSRIQLYVCNHEREDRESCGGKGSMELMKSLKKWAKHEHPGEIKVFRSGCLGKCSEGIAMACYPENHFWLNVNPEDEEDLKKDLEEALREVKEKN